MTSDKMELYQLHLPEELLYLQYEFSFRICDILFVVLIWGYSLVKATLVYFALDLLYIVIFSISSFVDYLNGEISRMKENKNV